ncbi:unnamed protein product [Chironomus riparius]|uniref:3-hydroxyisobutyryl-CoA hydrolase, mitochondrial n=1 Tax=Chironomus riparius TaxID=315576 RepID=A0A9N9S5I3_9DIPT|nr:unnamed protein product [Chironomus riparius]
MIPRVSKAVQSNHVLVKEVKNAAIVTLNRPEKMNTFTPWMPKQIYNTLKDLESSNNKLVVIQGAGNRAFCAGIDLGEFLKNKTTDSVMDIQIYASNSMDLISSYKKPYVALLDKIVMGGGCFFSMSSKYRIATERTTFAMPETEIGLFTNAGASYFLPRLKNNLGYYIGLAGSVVECQDDHEVEKAILQFSTEPICKDTELDEILPKIDKCFNADSVEEIMDNLNVEGSDWAKQVAKKLNRMSPTSVKICHRLIKLGSNLTLQEGLTVEHILAYNIGLRYSHDFQEGIRALIIDKDMKPQWNPKTLKDVTQEHVDMFFGPLPDDMELTFKSNVKKSKS